MMLQKKTPSRKKKKVLTGFDRAALRITRSSSAVDLSVYFQQLSQEGGVRVPSLKYAGCFTQQHVPWLALHPDARGTGVDWPAGCTWAEQGQLSARGGRNWPLQPAEMAQLQILLSHLFMQPASLEKGPIHHRIGFKCLLKNHPYFSFNFPLTF